MRLPLSLAALAVFTLMGVAQSQSLREQLKDTDIAPHWIYDDLPQAIQAAKG